MPLSINKDNIRTHLKSAPALKKVLDFIIMNQVQTRPRWFIRMLAPLYQKRGRGSVIYRSVRMDTPPYRHFALGRRSVIESFCCINNAVGDVIIGNDTRIGLHCTVIGPVVIGSHVNLAQGITISALNHNFADRTMPIDAQGVTTRPIVIEDDVWIGANAVVLPGVRIGKHAVVAAGSVVTRDVPSCSLVAGVPAVVKKHI